MTFQNLFDVDSWDNIPRSQKIDSFCGNKEESRLSVAMSGEA